MGHFYMGSNLPDISSTKMTSPIRETSMSVVDVSIIAGSHMQQNSIIKQSAQPTICHVGVNVSNNGIATEFDGELHFDEGCEYEMVISQHKASQIGLTSVFSSSTAPAFGGESLTMENRFALKPFSFSLPFLRLSGNYNLGTMDFS